MNKEELIQSLGKPFLRPLAIMQLLFLLLFMVSPFIWIWDSWNLAWKLGLSGIIGALVVFFAYTIVKQSISNIVDEEIDKKNHNTNKSNFQKKIELLQKKNNDILN